MVKGSSDPMTTPGAASDKGFHYKCPVAVCKTYELVETIQGTRDVKQCHEHDVDRALTLCKDPDCTITGARHRVP